MSGSHARLNIDWKSRIDSDSVLRAMGSDPHVMRDRQARFVILVEEIVSREIDRLRPSAAICELAVRNERRDRLQLENGDEFRNPTFCHKLAGAESVIVVVATIGGELERFAATCDAVARMVLDGLGTTAITALANSIADDIRANARTRDLNATNPLCPGMRGWELPEAQSQVFRLVDGRVAGVSINQSSMLTPSKSVSFLMGVGARAAEGPGVCDDCMAVRRCNLRSQFYAY